MLLAVLTVRTSKFVKDHMVGGALVEWDDLPADIAADDDSMGGGSDALPSSSGGVAGKTDRGGASLSRKKQKEGAEKKKRKKRRILPSAEVCAGARYTVATAIDRSVLTRSHSRTVTRHHATPAPLSSTPVCARRRRMRIRR
jgi:hypothetical protein